MFCSFFFYLGQNKASSGFLMTHVSLATSCCHIIGFCIALCVVSALNSQAILSKACIFTAKNKCSPFQYTFYLHLSVNRFAVVHDH